MKRNSAVGVAIPGWLAKVLPHGLVTKTSTVYGRDDMWLRGMTDTTSGGSFVKTAYENSAIAYACIRRQCVDAAGVPLKFLAKPDDDAKEVGPSDPVRKLLEQPNQIMSTARLIEWTVMLQCLRGEFFWLFDDPARPRAIYPWFDPLNWREIVTADAGLIAWEVSNNGNVQRHQAGAVLHCADSNPNNPYRGISPLQAARYALDKDVYGDKLAASTMQSGGESPLLFESEQNLNPDEYDQLSSVIKSRVSRSGEVGQPFIAFGGLKFVDPKFTKADLDILAHQTASKKRICHVYGMAPVLIGDDDSAQYKSAPEAIKLYWNQTLVPKLHAIEDAWDQFFVSRRGLGTFVRFDLSKVAALQRDELEKARVAQIYSNIGLPLVMINEHIGLGFDEATLAAAEEERAMREAEAAEQLRQQSQQNEPEPPAKALHKALTGHIIKSRSDRLRIETNRKRARLEAKTENAIRHVAGEYKAKTDKIIEDAFGDEVTLEAAYAAVRNVHNLREPLGKDLIEVVEPAMREAAAVGAASIQAVVDGKALLFDERRKAVSFTPNTQEVIRRRRRYITRDIPDDKVAAINEAILRSVGEAIDAGESVGYVQAAVRDIWNSMQNSQAATIARTETGTLYSTARNDEMIAQGFDSHEWVASIDEMTRELHADSDGEVRKIGETFPCGLEYPLQDGGEPGNVINCRCETIPALGD